ncbi:MAG: hypothetical protein KBD36_00055 [Alphaproteobacteria bacterium]|nr:hypothetical protein [Alphaproteobacteria bacterium]MBP9776230.1 hypothetical protein [Alphaproteobacteria bacterium]
MKNTLVSIVLNLFLANVACATLTEEDKIEARRSITISKFHEYEELWKDSNKHNRQQLYDSLSFFTKMLAIIAGVASGGIALSTAEVVSEDPTKDGISGSLAFVSVALVTLDGAWFQRKSTYFAGASQRLGAFLKEIAASLQRERNIDSEDKHELIYIIGEEFEHKRKAKGPEQPLLDIQF